MSFYEQPNQVNPLALDVEDGFTYPVLKMSDASIVSLYEQPGVKNPLAYDVDGGFTYPVVKVLGTFDSTTVTTAAVEAALDGADVEGMTLGNLREGTHTVANAGAALALNPTTAPLWTITTTEACTFTVADFVDGQSMKIRVTGDFTYTFTGVVWVGGTNGQNGTVPTPPPEPRWQGFQVGLLTDAQVHDMMMAAKDTYPGLISAWSTGLGQSATGQGFETFLTTWGLAQQLPRPSGTGTLLPPALMAHVAVMAAGFDLPGEFVAGLNPSV